MDGNSFITKILARESYNLWFLSLLLPAVAIALDAGYLSYFDIPITFAEVNLYILILTVVFILMALVCITAILLVALTLSKSKWVIVRALVQPVPIFVCILIVTFNLANGNSIWQGFWIYPLFITLNIISSLLSSTKNEKLVKRINSLDFTHKPLQIINTPAGKMYERLGTQVGLLFLLIFASMATDFVTSLLNVSVLKSSPNVIAIKRNNNLYILKRFNPKTNILENGYELTTIDRENLSLINLNSPGKLLTLASVEYKKTKKLHEEAEAVNDKILIEKFFNSISKWLNIYWHDIFINK